MAINMQYMPISGTGIQASGTVAMVQLFGQSGTTLIPIRVDNTGAIENTV